MADDGEFHDFYKYTPSKTAAIIFIVLFLITSSLHLFQLLKNRVWFFIPIVVGGAFEIVGFIGRIISNSEAPLFTDTPYIIQTLFLLLAPALFAASVYMEMGRIVLLLNGEKHALIRRTWMTKIFVTGDIFSFVVQGAGGGIMSGGTPSNQSLGENVIIAGLAIQLIFFGFFIIVSALFHRRMKQDPTAASLATTISWRRHLYGLYIASVLVITRSVFRLVEFIQGSEGELLSKEVYLYIFDAMLMWFLMVGLNVVHPGEIARAIRHENDGYQIGKNPESGGEEVGLTGRNGHGRRSRHSNRPSLVETAYARHAIATRGLA